MAELCTSKDPLSNFPQNSHEKIEAVQPSLMVHLASGRSGTSSPMASSLPLDVVEQAPGCSTSGGSSKVASAVDGGLHDSSMARSDSVHPDHQGSPALLHAAAVVAGSSPRQITDRETAKQAIRQQAEYYLSNHNLSSDEYLRSQMDTNLYVPISLIAAFPQMQRLTTDPSLVHEALKDSQVLEFNAEGTHIRPCHQIKKILLRNVGSEITAQDIMGVFDGVQCPQCTKVEVAHADSWYVMFESFEDAKQAYQGLRQGTKLLNGRRINAKLLARPSVIFDGNARRNVNPANHIGRGTQYPYTMSPFPGYQLLFPHTYMPEVVNPVPTQLMMSTPFVHPQPVPRPQQLHARTFTTNTRPRRGVFNGRARRRPEEANLAATRSQAASNQRENSRKEAVQIDMSQFPALPASPTRLSVTTPSEQDPAVSSSTTVGAAPDVSVTSLAPSPIGTGSVDGESSKRMSYAQIMQRPTAGSSTSLPRTGNPGSSPQGEQKGSLTANGSPASGAPDAPAAHARKGPPRSLQDDKLNPRGGRQLLHGPPSSSQTASNLVAPKGLVSRDSGEDSSRSSSGTSSPPQLDNGSTGPTSVHVQPPSTTTDGASEPWQTYMPKHRLGSSNRAGEVRENQTGTLLSLQGLAATLPSPSSADRSTRAVNPSGAPENPQSRPTPRPIHVEQSGGDQRP